MQVDDAQIDRMAARTGVPLYDPVWHATLQRMEKVTDDSLESTSDLRARLGSAVGLGVGVRRYPARANPGALTKTRT